MYAVGSKVVHPIHGAGTITDIQKQSMEGQSSTYYVIDTVSKSMSLMVPVEQAEDGRLRRIGKPQGLLETLTSLPQKPLSEEIASDYKARQKELQERIDTGEFEEVASAVRSLLLLKRRRRLGMSDRRMLDNGKDFLAGELALSLDLEVSEAMSRIESSLVQTMPSTED